MEQALDPLSKALPLSRPKSPAPARWLIQAGYREPRHLSMYIASRMLLALVGGCVVAAVSGLQFAFASGRRGRHSAFSCPALR